MQFTVNQATITKPLQLLSSVVDRRSALPILTHIRLQISQGQLTMTTTDMELEMIGQLKVTAEQEGDITVPARKLLDICRALPAGAEIHFTLSKEKALLRAGRSRFNLTTLPSDSFPASEGMQYRHQLSIAQGELKGLLDQTSFAMASEDVRHYLNGLLLEKKATKLHAIATDGHRLAHSDITLSDADTDDYRILLPRKTINELSRLLENDDSPVTISANQQQVMIALPDNQLQLTSKLIDGEFPDYQRVIPVNGDKTVIVERETLRQALSRVAILSHDRHRSLCIQLSEHLLTATVVNQEQESAEEEIIIDYASQPLEIAFNNAYLLDLLNAMPDNEVQLTFSDGNSSVLITPAVAQPTRQYVVMPIRL